MTSEPTNPTGPPIYGVKRTTKHDAGFEECYECSGDGACYLCHASGRYDGERCFNCNGSGRCIVCQGSGRLEQGALAGTTPAQGPSTTPGPIRYRCPVCGSDRVRGGHASIEGATLHDFFCSACKTLESKRDDETDYYDWQARWIDDEKTKAEAG